MGKTTFRLLAGFALAAGVTSGPQAWAGGRVCVVNRSDSTLRWELVASKRVVHRTHRQEASSPYAQWACTKLKSFAGKIEIRVGEVGDRHARAFQCRAGIRADQWVDVSRDTKAGLKCQVKSDSASRAVAADSTSDLKDKVLGEVDGLLPTDITAFVHNFEKGPLNKPVFVTGMNEFWAIFGQALPGEEEEGEDQVAQYFLNGGTAAWIVRVGDAERPLSAKDLIGGKAGGFHSLEMVDPPVNTLTFPAIGSLSLEDATQVYSAVIPWASDRARQITVLFEPPNLVYFKKAKPDADDVQKSLAPTLEWANAVAPQLQSRYSATFFPRMDGHVPTKPGLALSGGVAGILASLAREQGVWVAPANILFLTSTQGEFLPYDMDQAGKLRLAGVPINSVHFFNGMGPMLWGEGTGAPQSEDFKYLHISRTVAAIDLTLQGKLLQYFNRRAPNNARTWSEITAEFSNFLTSLWAAGALQGFKAADSFTVACGLGTTMTSEDVEEGLVKVQITVALAHPAQFQVLAFETELPVE